MWISPRRWQDAQRDLELARRLISTAWIVCRAEGRPGRLPLWRSRGRHPSWGVPALCA